MAFNLNKNDGSNLQSSKFDLSKRETIIENKRSNKWTIGLAVVLISGFGIFYLSLSTKTSDTLKNQSIKIGQNDSIQSRSAAKNTRALATDGHLNGHETIEKLTHMTLVTFAPGSATFASRNQQLITLAVSYLTENPKASISVDGYASSDGPLAQNLSIAQARADEFKKYLVSRKIKEDRINAVGKGIDYPIASNETMEGRKKNRRVEVTFL